jgi:hypothetical protein
VAGRRRDPHAAREAVALFLAGLVGVVWSVTTIASVFFDRPLDGQVHVIMLAVVSGMLGTAGISAWAGSRNGKPGNGA